MPTQSEPELRLFYQRAPAPPPAKATPAPVLFQAQPSKHRRSQSLAGAELEAEQQRVEGNVTGEGPASAVDDNAIVWLTHYTTTQRDTRRSPRKQTPLRASHRMETSAPRLPPSEPVSRVGRESMSHKRATSWDPRANAAPPRRNNVDMATIEKLLSAKREELAQRERELRQRQALQTAQLEALRAGALDDLNEELELLKQRTNEIQDQVRAMRCPGPTPRQMISGRHDRPGPSSMPSAASSKPFSSQRPENRSVVRVAARKTPSPVIDSNDSVAQSAPANMGGIGFRSLSPNASRSVSNLKGFSSAFSSYEYE